MDVADRISRIEGARDRCVASKIQLESEISGLIHHIELLSKSSEAIRSILQNLVDDEKDGIRDIITEGLKAIYEDQDLSMRINTSVKRGKVNIDFNVYDGLKNVEGNILDSFGGGVANIVSLLFRFITIMRLGLRKFIVLDESLLNISSSGADDYYVDNTGKFLKSLCAKTGFDVLLVTHQPKFLDYADTAYMGGLNGSEMALTKMGKSDDAI